jgi:murein DD-endopeptidase MepM/ murein hydrolase activator NlpD
MMRRRILAASAALGLGAAASATAAPVTVAPPGGVVRWAGAELRSCSIGSRSWTPLDGACWYPIDLEARGRIALVRRSIGGVASRWVEVGEYPYPTEHLQVEEKYVEPPPEALERIERERRRAAAIFARETPRGFTLPLAPPLEPLPAAGRFGARRIFNGRPRSPHGGADYRAAPGTPVRAAADGVVALAEEHYFAGRSVFLDHGDGLISMSFHLSEILVAPGDAVRRGDPIGRVGATGRVTGPHLHFALRWHGARVDPALLLARGAPPVDIR